MDRDASSAVRSTNVEQLLTPASAVAPLEPPEEPPEDEAPDEPPDEEPPDDEPPELDDEDEDEPVDESEHAMARPKEATTKKEELMRILQA